MDLGVLDNAVFLLVSSCLASHAILALCLYVCRLASRPRTVVSVFDSHLGRVVRYLLDKSLSEKVFPM